MYNYDKHLEQQLDNRFNTDYYVCKCGCEFDTPFRYNDEDGDNYYGCPDCGSTDFKKD